MDNGLEITEVKFNENHPKDKRIRTNKSTTITISIKTDFPLPCEPTVHINSATTTQPNAFYLFFTIPEAPKRVEEYFSVTTCHVEKCESQEFTLHLDCKFTLSLSKIFARRLSGDEFTSRSKGRFAMRYGTRQCNSVVKLPLYRTSSTQGYGEVSSTRVHKVRKRRTHRHYYAPYTPRQPSFEGIVFHGVLPSVSMKVDEETRCHVELSRSIDPGSYRVWFGLGPEYANCGLPKKLTVEGNTTVTYAPKLEDFGFPLSDMGPKVEASILIYDQDNARIESTTKFTYLNVPGNRSADVTPDLPEKMVTDFVKFSEAVPKDKLISLKKELTNMRHLDNFLAKHPERLDLKQKDNAESNVLHYLTVFGCVKTIRKLVDLGSCPSPKQQNSRGITPLHLAAFAGNAELVTLFLKQLNNESISELKDSNGNSPNDVAKLCKRERICDIVNSYETKEQSSAESQPAQEMRKAEK